jgi:late competence protein required for DNA uptake (superfamily II DNA/RNA helicase)
MKKESVMSRNREFWCHRCKKYTLWNYHGSNMYGDVFQCDICHIVMNRRALESDIGPGRGATNDCSSS